MSGIATGGPPRFLDGSAPGSHLHREVISFSDTSDNPQGVTSDTLTGISAEEVIVPLALDVPHVNTLAATQDDRNLGNESNIVSPNMSK